MMLIYRAALVCMGLSLRICVYVYGPAYHLLLLMVLLRLLLRRPLACIVPSVTDVGGMSRQQPRLLVAGQSNLGPIAALCGLPLQIRIR